MRNPEWQHGLDKYRVLQLVRAIKADDNGCLNWPLAVADNGYGRVKFNKRTALAHRASYITHVGPIPDGFHIDHLCRNRRCVNPEHLEAVSQAENNRRAHRAKQNSGVAA